MSIFSHPELLQYFYDLGILSLDEYTKLKKINLLSLSCIKGSKMYKILNIIQIQRWFRMWRKYGFCIEADRVEVKTDNMTSTIPCPIYIKFNNYFTSSTAWNCYIITVPYNDRTTIFYSTSDLNVGKIVLHYKNRRQLNTKKNIKLLQKYVNESINNKKI